MGWARPPVLIFLLLVFGGGRVATLFRGTKREHKWGAFKTSIKYLCSVVRVFIITVYGNAAPGCRWLALHRGVRRGMN